jgi:Fur family transcriptional regulator, ferric uptake regulator
MTQSFHPEELRAHGYRLTPQRLAILQVIQESQGHLSASDIFERAGRKMPGLTEATIYRTLDFLVAQGLALIAHIGSGRIVYESAENAHHHLICRKCGGSVAVPQSDLQPIYDRLESVTGFQLNVSHLTFFGLCPVCKADPPTQPE